MAMRRLSADITIPVSEFKASWLGKRMQRNRFSGWKADDAKGGNLTREALRAELRLFAQTELTLLLTEKLSDFSDRLNEKAAPAKLTAETSDMPFCAQQSSVQSTMSAVPSLTRPRRATLRFGRQPSSAALGSTMAHVTSHTSASRKTCRMHQSWWEPPPMQESSDEEDDTDDDAGGSGVDSPDDKEQPMNHATTDGDYTAGRLAVGSSQTAASSMSPLLSEQDSDEDRMPRLSVLSSPTRPSYVRSVHGPEVLTNRASCEAPARHEGINPDALLESGRRTAFKVSESLSERAALLPPLKMHAKLVLSSNAFEYAFSTVILMNAAILGLEADYVAANPSSPVPAFFGICETCFCIAFTFELAVRLFVSRLRFFTGAGATWNIFDAFVVGLAILDLCSEVCAFFSLPISYGFIKVLRVLRVIRIARLIRVVRLFEQLHTIVASMAASMKALGWTLLLMLLHIYIFSVVFTKVAQEATPSDHTERLEYWFGRLGRSSLTLFESILGGVSWNEVIEPLILGVSPWMGLLYCIYIGFCQFAMMNVVTGVFVDSAISTAQEDQDAYAANHISELFLRRGIDGRKQDKITWSEFARKLHTDTMQDYFKTLRVDTTEARGLFDLLDMDGDGQVDADEIVSGCLRLRGNAKALELSLLMRELRDLTEIILGYPLVACQDQSCESWDEPTGSGGDQESPRRASHVSFRSDTEDHACSTLGYVALPNDVTNGDVISFVSPPCATVATPTSSRRSQTDYDDADSTGTL